MKKLHFILFISIAILSLSCSNNNGVSEQNDEGVTVMTKDVNVQEFAQLINDKEGQILDVRTPGEWAEGTIKGAIKLDYFNDNFKKNVLQM